MFFFIMPREGKQSSIVPTCRGPYPSKEAAVLAAEGLPPGNWAVCGPASPVREVYIAAPVVTSKDIEAATDEA